MDVKLGPRKKSPAEVEVAPIDPITTKRDKPQQFKAFAFLEGFGDAPKEPWDASKDRDRLVADDALQPVGLEFARRRHVDRCAAQKHPHQRSRRSNQIRRRREPQTVFRRHAMNFREAERVVKKSTMIWKTPFGVPVDPDV